MTGNNRQEGSIGMILGGLAIMAVFGLLTRWQIERINDESYWIIFRVWFIPIPIVIITALGTLGGLVLFFQGLRAGFHNLSRRTRG
jgi:hypothetical protein